MAGARQVYPLQTIDRDAVLARFAAESIERLSIRARGFSVQSESQPHSHPIQHFGVKPQASQQADLKKNRKKVSIISLI